MQPPTTHTPSKVVDKVKLSNKMGILKFFKRWMAAVTEHPCTNRMIVIVGVSHMKQNCTIKFYRPGL